MRSDQIVRNARLTLAECEAEARKQGHEGPWTPTMQDVDWVIMTLGGRKPTAEEWREVFSGWVGGKHVGGAR